MALPSVTALDIENNLFPPTVTPPGSTDNFFLGGAGERGLQIQDKFVKFTAIGVYLQDIAVPYLATKWKGKTAQELTETIPFFRDIVTGTYNLLTILQPFFFTSIIFVRLFVRIMDIT
jgi:chalcone isomerase